MNSWSKNICDWVENDTAYVSVPFTWNLPNAYSKCVWYRQQGYKVRSGGCAVSLIPDYLKDVAQIGGEVNALPRHNPNATFTSRGCIRKCSFCAVPRIEGELKELDSWEVKPIVCDNNLLACSRVHFDRVIDRLKAVKGIDFNQGLDCRLLSDHHIERLQELDIATLRFSWDFIGSENEVMDSINRCIASGFSKNKIRIYVLFGFNDTPDDALYRFETLKTMGIRANPQRYQPLDALVKDRYIAQNWTNRELKRFMRYWARQNWLSKIPFEEYV